MSTLPKVGLRKPRHDLAAVRSVVLVFVFPACVRTRSSQDTHRKNAAQASRGWQMGEIVDLAREIVTMLEIDDRVSDMELHASGVDHSRGPHSTSFCDILKVTTELVRGRLHFVVEYRDNSGYQRNERNERVSAGPWQKIVYDKDDWEGVAGFVDGFLGCGGRSNTLDLRTHKQGVRHAPIVCTWMFDRKSRDDGARGLQFRSAVKALLGQTRSCA